MSKKDKPTREDAPQPRLLLPELRAWNVVLWSGTKKISEEVVTGHALSFPFQNMIAVIEYEMIPGEQQAKSMIRKVVVGECMTFDECTTPSMNGSMEIM